MLSDYGVKKQNKKDKNRNFSDITIWGYLVALAKISDLRMLSTFYYFSSLRLREPYIRVK